MGQFQEPGFHPVVLEVVVKKFCECSLTPTGADGIRSSFLLLGPIRLAAFRMYDVAVLDDDLAVKIEVVVEAFYVSM